jgi:hypothetical protein
MQVYQLAVMIAAPPVKGASFGAPLPSSGLKPPGFRRLASYQAKLVPIARTWAETLLFCVAVVPVVDPMVKL